MGRVPHCRRLLLVAALLTALGLATPQSAVAHNGVGAAFKGRTGHYTVYAYDGFPAPRSAVTYRVVLLDHVRGGPAYDVHISGAARRVGTASAQAVDASNVQVFANVAYLTLPNPYPGDWQIRLRLTGHPGNATIAFRMHGVAPDASSKTPVVSEDSGNATSTVLYVIGGVALIALVVGLVVTLRRRAPS
jgi:hypothetical protein